MFGVIISFLCSSIKIVNILQTNNSYSNVFQRNSYIFFIIYRSIEVELIKSKRATHFDFWVTLFIFYFIARLLYNRDNNATVELSRFLNCYTTLTLNYELILRNTKLNKLLGNSLSTSL